MNEKNSRDENTQGDAGENSTLTHQVQIGSVTIALTGNPDSTSSRRVTLRVTDAENIPGRKDFVLNAIHALFSPHFDAGFSTFDGGRHYLPNAISTAKHYKHFPTWRNFVEAVETVKATYPTIDSLDAAMRGNQQMPTPIGQDEKAPHTATESVRRANPIIAAVIHSLREDGYAIDEEARGRAQRAGITAADRGRG